MSDTDLFRARLNALNNLRDLLILLATRMPRDQIEASVLPFLNRRLRMGRFSSVLYLFGTTAQVAGVGVNPGGLPRLPIRFIFSLLHLKHAYGFSDDETLQRLVRDVCFQLFGSQFYFQIYPACDSSLISRICKDLGAPWVEELLRSAFDAILVLQALKKSDLLRVKLDSFMQEEAIAHLAESRLREVVRKRVVYLVQRFGIAIKQTYNKKFTTLRRRAGGNARTKQFNHQSRAVKRQCTVLCMLMREVLCNLIKMPRVAQTPLQALLTLVGPVAKEQAKEKVNTKVFALLAPEVECIGKGKVRQSYEWGCKVSISVTDKHGLVVGARSFAGIPFHGHPINP